MDWIYEGRCCKAGYDKDTNRISLLFFGQSIIHEYDKMTEELLKLVRIKTIAAILYDLSKFDGSFLLLNSHVINKLLPKLLSDCKNEALVLNDKTLYEFDIDLLFYRSKKISIQIFSNIENAIKWINLKQHLHSSIYGY